MHYALYIMNYFVPLQCKKQSINEQITSKSLNRK